MRKDVTSGGMIEAVGLLNGISSVRREHLSTVHPYNSRCFLLRFRLAAVNFSKNFETEMVLICYLLCYFLTLSLFISFKSSCLHNS